MGLAGIQVACNLRLVVGATSQQAANPVLRLRWRSVMYHWSCPALNGRGSRLAGLFTHQLKQNRVRTPDLAR